MNIRFPVALLVFLFIGLHPPTSAHAQRIEPSVYIGGGMSTNVGGLVGLGTEVRVGSRFAVSAALGTWPEAASDNGVTFGQALDYDLGAKFYVLPGRLYTGVNYGLLDAELGERALNPCPVFPGGPTFSATDVVCSSETETILDKVHGLTLSLGGRTPSWNGLYVSGFFGVASDLQDSSFPLFNDRATVPRVGLLLGFELR